MSVTPKGIQSVYASPNDTNLKPVVQVLSVSSLAGQTGRFKVILSDGETYTTGLLASHFIQSLGGTCPFKQYQLVSLDNYQVNSVQDKHFLLIHGLSEISGPLGGQIGNPVAFKGPVGGASTAQNPAHLQAPANNQFNQPVQPYHPPYQQQTAPQQPNPYAYPTLGNNPYAAPSSSNNGSSTISAATSNQGFVNPYERNPSSGPPGGFVNPYDPHPSSGAPARNAAPLTRHPSLPSHTPFAAGMNQSIAQNQIPYAQQTVGPVRYMQPIDQVTPMSQLTIYTQKWTIKARVSAKSEMRTFRNAKGEGQLMNIDLVDSQQTEMRATFFGSAAQKFYPILQVGKVFTFSKGSVKPANPKFNPRAQYELMFDDHSEIVEVVDDGAIPSMKIDIVSISKIPELPVGSNVDIAGIVMHVGDVGLVTVKSTGKETHRRTITVADDSGNSIDVTIWGDRSERLGDDMKSFLSRDVALEILTADRFQLQHLLKSRSTQTTQKVLSLKDGGCVWDDHPPLYPYRSVEEQQAHQALPLTE
jgi:replication factor A1